MVFIFMETKFLILFMKLIVKSGFQETHPIATSYSKNWYDATLLPIYQGFKMQTNYQKIFMLSHKPLCALLMSMEDAWTHSSFVQLLQLPR